MRRLAAALVLLLAAASSAHATEESEALSARALVAFEAGDEAEALRLFDAAVVADPNDAVALYQRGVAKTKAGDAAAGRADLEQALKIRPGLNEAALELGVSLIDAGTPAEAVPWLQQAARQTDLAGQAEFFLGMAQLRQDDLVGARAHFERARTLDPKLDVTSRYYLGVIEYREGHLDTAREHFNMVRLTSPESAVGRESAAFLDLMQAGGGSGTKLYGGVYIQYDSNVVLAPAQGAPASGQADGRVALNAGVLYDAWRGENAKLTLGYDFYQNLQFELKDFNLMDNRPSALFSMNLGPARAGVLTQYDFYLLETSSFLQTVTLRPFVVIPESETTRTEVFFRYQWRDYLQDDFDILDGNNLAGGFWQVFGLGAQGRELWGGLQIDGQDPTQPGGEVYAYEGIQAEVSLLWPLPWETTAQVGYRFRREQYDAATLDFTDPIGVTRLDRENRAGVALRKNVNDMISVVVSWIGTWNDSTKTVFEYDRQIASLGVEVRY